MEVSKNIWKIYFFRFLTGLHFIGAVLIPFFIDWGGQDFFKIMLLQTVFMGSVFLFEIPTGVVADRFSRKASLIFGAFITMIGCIVYVAYPSFWVFLIGELIWGLGQALLSGADEAFLYDTLKQVKKSKESKKILSRAHNYFLAGIMVSGPIGSLIFMMTDDLRMPFLFMAIPFLAAAIFGFTLEEPKRFEKIQEAKRYLLILKEGVTFFYNHKILKILAFDLIIVGAVVHFIVWFDQVIYMRAGIKIEYFGILKFIIVAAQILVISQYHRLEKVLKAKKRLIIYTGLIASAMFIVIGFINWAPVAIIATTVIAGFGLSRDPLFSSYMNKYIPSEKRATVISSVNMLRTFVLVALNPFIGLIADSNLSLTFFILGAVGIIFSLISRARIQEKMLID